jgi:hypothetical protein
VTARTISFAAPIGLSAFMLFTVEPLVGRLALPIFGGTPAVWATTLFFFQTVLLAGYLYAHVSATWFGRWGPPVHVALAGLGIGALILAPRRLDSIGIDGLPPALGVVVLLSAVIGLPAFILTTTTPLLSSWFAGVRDSGRVDDGRADDPYWLYALSNGGSLLALLAYPLVIEPRLGLGDQRGLWLVAFVLLAAMLAIAAVRAAPAINQRAREVAQTATDMRTERSRPIDAARRLRWILLAAIPSGLLCAVTTFIATDLVSAPMLWVWPLAIYLGSFIVAFSPRGRRYIPPAIVAAPAMVTLLWVPFGSAGAWPVLATLLVELVALGIVAVALHGRLAEDRPDPAHLTEFYLLVSTGGALASAFVALAAPVIFPDVWEYPILLVGALVALALTAPPVARRVATAGRGLDLRPFVEGIWGRMVPYLVVSGLLAFGLIATGSLATEAGLRWLLVGGLVLAVGARPWFLAGTTAFVLVLATFILQPPADFRERSFFGVTTVQRTASLGRVVLFNGTTVHGTQSTDPALRHIPTTYYSEGGPAGDLFSLVRSIVEGRTAQVGVVGLGAGTLGAYVTPELSMSFFEIDPVVVRVASDPAYFTYLSDAPVAPRIVLGDARLSLEDEPAGEFDLVVLDAFSSDSIPVHLLTTEAIATEWRTVRSGGLVAFHISNRYYDLTPAIAAGAGTLGLTVLERTHTPDATGQAEGATPARWLAATDDQEAIATLLTMGWTKAVAADHPFTDDYSDLIRYLHLGG